MSHAPVRMMMQKTRLWLPVVTLVVAACGSSPVRDSDDVPLPPRADLVTPEGPGAATAGNEEPASPEAATPAAGTTDPTQPAVSLPEGPPRWFPPVGTTIRMAGIAPRDMVPLVESRTVRPGGGEDRLELDVEVRAEGDEDEDVARETYLVTVLPDEVRIALAPDPLRRIPGPAREVPREPVVGQSWETPAGTCRVEAVRQEVTTFAGPRTGCARVRLTSPTGRITFRWFDPELGEVRREILDRDDKVLAAWALCGADFPSVERCREILLR